VISQQRKDNPLKIKHLIAGIFAFLIVSHPVLAEAGPKWLTSWDEAAKQSKASGKPILIDFTGSDWCGWCVKLKKEVFDTEHFKTWAAKKVVLLEVDFPRKKPLPAKQQTANEELAAKYGVQGFPTIIFADHKGATLGQYGYDEGGPQAWTSKAETMLKKK
jgi:thioredoxin-related protein